MLVNFLIFAAVMIFLLYGTKYLRHATPENLQKLGKPAAGVGALVLAGILFLRGHMEMGIALGGFTSPQAAADFGFDDEQGNRLGEAYWRQFVHPDDVERVFGGTRRSTETGASFEDLYRWILPDGRTIWMLDRARATRWDPERREGEFHGVMVDVTDLVEGRVSREG